jgi:hypothetical protein
LTGRAWVGRKHRWWAGQHWRYHLAGVSRCWTAHGPATPRQGSMRRANELPNKEMKLTSVECIGRSQLISSVRRTLRRMRRAA